MAANFFFSKEILHKNERTFFMTELVGKDIVPLFWCLKTHQHMELIAVMLHHIYKLLAFSTQRICQYDKITQTEEPSWCVKRHHTDKYEVDA